MDSDDSKGCAMTTMTAADGAPLSGRLSGWRLLLVSLAITILVVAFLMGWATAAHVSAHDQLVVRLTLVTETWLVLIAASLAYIVKGAPAHAAAWVKVPVAACAQRLGS